LGNIYKRLEKLFSKEHIDVLNEYLDSKREKIIKDFESYNLNNDERAINQGKLKSLKDIKNTFNNLKEKLSIEQLTRR